jgi:hypothetical protein
MAHLRALLNCCYMPSKQAFTEASCGKPVDNVVENLSKFCFF